MPPLAARATLRGAFGTPVSRLSLRSAHRLSLRSPFFSAGAVFVSSVRSEGFPMLAASHGLPLSTSSLRPHRALLICPARGAGVFSHREESRCDFPCRWCALRPIRMPTHHPYLSRAVREDASRGGLLPPAPCPPSPFAGGRIIPLRSHIVRGAPLLRVRGRLVSICWGNLVPLSVRPPTHYLVPPALPRKATSL